MELIFKSKTSDNYIKINAYLCNLMTLTYPIAFELYEDVPAYPYEISHVYTYEEVMEQGGTINEDFSYEYNESLTIRANYSASSSYGLQRVYINLGLFSGSTSYSTIVNLVSDTSQQVSLYSSTHYSFVLVDPSKKRAFSMTPYYSEYTGYQLQPGEDTPRASNMYVKFKNTPKNTYRTNEGWYIGNQLIDRAVDYIRVPLGSTMRRVTINYYNNDTQFYNILFENVKFPSYPNQNPDNDDDSDGQSPSDPPIPGDGDTSSDPIPNPPSMPIFDVTNTGFVVIYNPNVQEIRELAYFMWSGEFVDLIKKMFASPFEAIISLKMLFCPITSGASQTVWLGNVETDVTMDKVTSQFTDVDMGTLNVNEFFGSFADYSPFTKIQIYLPFIGFKDLNVDEVMNSQLHLRYRVDVYTGACIAYLTVTKTIKSTNLNSILYQFDGNCAMEIPFTSNDNSRYVAAIMNSVASSALSLANTSGFTLPTPAKGFNQKAEQGTFELGSLAPVANGMLDIMSAKPNVQRAGSLSGAVSAMAVKQPYLIIHRPIAQMPANYQHYIGIPLNLTRTLSNVKGFTVVSQVFLTSDIATDEEIVMITEMLKNGVIF